MRKATDIERSVSSMIITNGSWIAIFMIVNGKEEKAFSIDEVFSPLLLIILSLFQFMNLFRTLPLFFYGDWSLLKALSAFVKVMLPSLCVGLVFVIGIYFTPWFEGQDSQKLAKQEVVLYVKAFVAFWILQAVIRPALVKITLTLLSVHTKPSRTENLVIDRDRQTSEVEVSWGFVGISIGLILAGLWGMSAVFNYGNPITDTELLNLYDTIIEVFVFMAVVVVLWTVFSIKNNDVGQESLKALLKDAKSDMYKLLYYPSFIALMVGVLWHFQNENIYFLLAGGIAGFCLMLSIPYTRMPEWQD